MTCGKQDLTVTSAKMGLNTERRVAALEAGVLDETGVTCCYARSDKTWARDPGGLAWETFLTHGDAETYGGPAGQPDPAAPTADPEASPCCAGSGDIRQRCC